MKARRREEWKERKNRREGATCVRGYRGGESEELWDGGLREANMTNFTLNNTIKHF